ncbi:MAG: alkaline phosphatase family protein [Polyangiales bacterium]
MAGKHWNETAIILTWDDFGGFYDHVPPAVEKLTNGSFFNTGFRLPADPNARDGRVGSMLSAFYFA